MPRRCQRPATEHVSWTIRRKRTAGGRGNRRWHLFPNEDLRKLDSEEVALDSEEMALDSEEAAHVALPVRDHQLPRVLGRWLLRVTDRRLLLATALGELRLAAEVEAVFRVDDAAAGDSAAA